MRLHSVEPCFQRRILPIVWDPGPYVDLLSRASSIILQRGSIAELPRVLNQFAAAPLQRLPLLVHVDLLAGLECNAAGVEFLASFERISGVVTAHQQVVAAARRQGLISILRLFLMDGHSLERGLAAVAKARPDAVEIMPNASAPALARDLRRCSIPRIAGGLCRTKASALASLTSGYQAVTTSHPPLWRLNATFATG